MELTSLNEKLDLVSAVKDINESTLMKQSQAVAEISRLIERSSAYLAMLKERLEKEKNRVLSYNQRKQREMEESMALLTGKNIEVDVLEPIEIKPEAKKTSAWSTVVKKEVKPETNGHVIPVSPSTSVPVVEYKFKDTALGIKVYLINNPNEAAHPSRRGYLCWMESQNRFWFWLSGQLMQCQAPCYVHQGQKYKMLDFDVSYLHSSGHPDSTNFYRNPLDFPDSTDVRGYYHSVQVIAASRAGNRSNQYAMPVGDLSTASEDLTRANTHSLRRQADWGTSQMLMSLLINQELTQRSRAKSA